MSRNLANFILIVALFVVGCLSYSLLYSLTGVDEERNYPQMTAQECANNYQASPSNVRAQWGSSEEYMNECVQ